MNKTPGFIKETEENKDGGTQLMNYNAANETFAK